MSLFKDEWDERKCTDCDGKGFTQSYKGTMEGNIEYRQITEQPVCYTCKGTGIEKYVKHYALFKEFKIKEGGIHFKILWRDVEIVPTGWYNIFRWIGWHLVWKWALHKILERMKVPYDYYRFEHSFPSFSVLSYFKDGGDYMISDHYFSTLSILGIDIRSWWKIIPDWVECTKCGNYTLKKLNKDNLCTDCLYPKIIVEVPIKERM